MNDFIYVATVALIMVMTWYVGRHVADLVFEFVSEIVRELRRGGGVRIGRRTGMRARRWLLGGLAGEMRGRV